jgi:predicted metalloprotease with PDZ domain
MRIWRSVACIAAAGVVIAAFAPAPPRLDYVFSPVLEAGALRAIEVEARFRGDADGETKLRLPNAWAGEQELWKSIADLRVRSGAEMAGGAHPAARVLRHSPNADIRIVYRIVQDWAGPPMATGRNPHRAIVQPNYFHVIGNVAIVAPERDEDTPVRFRVRNLPRGWTFASDLEHRALTLRELYRSISVGGDFRVLRGAKDRNIRVAIRGAWSFDDAALVEEAETIIAAQRRYWGDGSGPFLITVLQVGQTAGASSLGGTGLSGSFAFFATANIERARMTRTLAHEALHNWIPQAIGDLPKGRGEPAHYWLSEGFTDFMTARLLVRSGLWNPSAYADDLNETLREYAISPARIVPNARIAEAFWTDDAVGRLPYQRGRLLALMWDARLRANGARDFDDAMMEMRRRARTQDLKAPALFQAVLSDFGAAIGDDLQAFVERGGPILLPEDVLAPCGRVRTRDMAMFHRGFDVQATIASNYVIAGVDPQGPAFAAGMRDGMRIIAREGGVIGDSEKEIAYRVEDKGVERVIQYLPQGRGRMAVQEFVLDEGLAGDSLRACLRVLAGE